MSVQEVSGKRAFPTTRWTLVAAADDPVLGSDAVGELYQIYWPAVYAYVRHRGHNREDSEDLVQSFFSHLLESRAFKRANPQRGRFRSFLLTVLKNFMASQYQHRIALKRGGDPRLVVDATLAEAWYATCAVAFDPPDRVYNRRWALALLSRARRRLRREFVEQRKAQLFDNLAPYLVQSPRARGGAPAVDGAQRVALYRFRRRFGELLREEIRLTVASPEEETGELRHLLDAIGRHHTYSAG